MALGYKNDEHKKAAEAIASGTYNQSTASSTGGTGGSGGGYGFGGYTPSDKVTGALDNIANGSYIKNPYAYDPNETNPFEVGTEEANNWDTDRADLIKNSEEWENGWKGYEGKEGLKYLADQGFSDEDLEYIFGQMYEDPRFEGIVSGLKDSGGNLLDIADVYSQFANGDLLGEDVDGNPVYSGGYLTPAEEPTTPTEPATEPAEEKTEDEIIYEESRDVYANKMRYYRGIYTQAMDKNPSLTWDGFSGFLEDILKADNEFRTAKEAMETAAEEIEKAPKKMTIDDAIQNALDAASSSQLAINAQNSAEYENAAMQYANFDFSYNPFTTREDSNLYNEAAKRAQSEGYEIGTSEFAEATKKYFLLAKTGYNPDSAPKYDYFETEPASTELPIRDSFKALDERLSTIDPSLQEELRMLGKKPRQMPAAEKAPVEEIQRDIEETSPEPQNVFETGGDLSVEEHMANALDGTSARAAKELDTGAAKAQAAEEKKKQDEVDAAEEQKRILEEQERTANEEEEAKKQAEAARNDPNNLAYWEREDNPFTEGTDEYQAFEEARSYGVSGGPQNRLAKKQAAYEKALKKITDDRAKAEKEKADKEAEEKRLADEEAEAKRQAEADKKDPDKLAYWEQEKNPFKEGTDEHEAFERTRNEGVSGGPQNKLNKKKAAFDKALADIAKEREKAKADEEAKAAAEAKAKEEEAKRNDPKNMEYWEREDNPFDENVSPEEYRAYEAGRNYVIFGEDSPALRQGIFNDELAKEKDRTKRQSNWENTSTKKLPDDVKSIDVKLDPLRKQAYNEAENEYKDVNWEDLVFANDLVEDGEEIYSEATPSKKLDAKAYDMAKDLTIAYYQKNGYGSGVSPSDYAKVFEKFYLRIMAYKNF